MKIELSAAFVKIAVGLASAALIGGGTAVIKTVADNGRQDIRLDHVERRLERTDDVISSLDKAVRQLDRNVAVLNERLAHNDRMQKE